MDANQYQNHLRLQLELQSFWKSQLALPRYQDPKRLVQFGHKVFSQNDEDGIIQEILNRIGCASETFVEFGVGDGTQCNSLFLLLQRWKGVWIEKDADAAQKISQRFKRLVDGNLLSVKNELVSRDNIDGLLQEACKGVDPDVLSIDIDFNDYWIWKSIESIRPRLVVIEYNSAWMPPLSVTVPYTEGAPWNGSNYFGASLAALAKLGKQKGYSLVGCCFAGVNAFMVRDDLLKDRFLTPGDAVEHYEPSRYFMSMLAPGHPAGFGPLVSV